MKKANIKKRNSVMASAQNGNFAVKKTKRRASSHQSSTIAKSVNLSNYAKVLSYIVNSEESEISMMVAASGSTSTF